MRITKDLLESFSARAKRGRVVAFDTETTGCSRYDQICQIAAAEFVGGEPARTFKVFVRPTCPMSPFAQAVHGLSPTFLRSHGIRPMDAMERFFEFIGADALVVAHNATFDLRMLRQECTHFRIPHDPDALDVCDTLALAKKLCPDLPCRRLEHLIGALGIDGINSHDALDDALACAGVFFKLLEKPLP